jgi:hypothetical protein
MLKVAFVLGCLTLACTAPASANEKADRAACEAMQATLAPREAEIAEMTEARNASAERVATAAKAWESVEAHRSISSRYAAVADRDKAALEAAREQLARDELALQSVAGQFEGDMAAFDARCSAGN